MDINDGSQSTKKLNYHKISKQHSSMSNEWNAHNNVSTSPTHNAKRYTNIISPDYNNRNSNNNNNDREDQQLHYSSEPKDNEGVDQAMHQYQYMSTDSFEDQVQSTVQAISDYDTQSVPITVSVSMKSYLNKSSQLLSILNSSIIYFNKTKDLIITTTNSNNNNKTQSHLKPNNNNTHNDIQLLLQQINSEKQKRKELEDALHEERRKANQISQSSVSNPEYISQYNNYMEKKIKNISDKNAALQQLIRQANTQAMNGTNTTRKLEHFLSKEIDRAKRVLALISSNNTETNTNPNKEQQHYCYIINNDNNDGDEGGYEQFKITNQSNKSDHDNQKLSDEAIAEEGDCIKVDQMYKQMGNNNAKGVCAGTSAGANKTSENSIDNIAFKDFNNNYHSNSNMFKMTNGATKSFNYKTNTNTSNMSNSGNNTKANYAIPKRFSKK